MGSNEDNNARTLGRRTFLSACGLAGAGLALPISLGGCGSESGGGPDGGGGLDGGTALDGTVGPRAPLVIPPLLEGELDNLVRVFRLELRAGEMDFGGTAPTATYGVNGDYLGPTMRFLRGERVRIEVKNTLAESTTLHWHGMQVPATADGGPYQIIEPGETWVAEYDVVQRPLTAWYHPHKMHHTGRQVYMGMAGMIVVEDPAATVSLPTTYGVDDLPLVIQDRRFSPDGTHPYSPGQTLFMHDMMAGLKGETMMVNGVINSHGRVAKGLVRLRILNGSNARNYNLGFGDDRSFQLIASDGGLLEAPLSTNRVLLAPGERAELLVDFSADETGAAIALKSYSGEVFGSLFTGGMGAALADALDRVTFSIATFEVGDPLSTAVTPPASFEVIERMTEAQAVRTRQVALSMGMGNVFINGVRMTDVNNVPAAISFDVPVGDTEMWVLSNGSGMPHPLHIHHNQFQVLDINGAMPPPALAGWKDTVLVGPGQTVRVLVKFDGPADAVNPYMFHCHILEHEDHGMMGRFFLTNG